LLHHLSIKELITSLSEKKLSYEELFSYYQERIQKFNPKLNAFISVNESFLDQDSIIATKLKGIPIAHKDIFCMKGHLTTCGSKMLANFKSPYDATIITRLASAGALTLGKTNMDEFAMGSSNETSFFGPCKNPWDLKLVPGGSSGGSASAVAARLAPIATATDTGGSIRQPAAFCGVTGLKPTYGLISRFGMIAFASSLDQAGFIAPSAQDIAIFYDIASGYDPKDSTSINDQVASTTKNLDQKPNALTIGIAKSSLDKHADPSILNAIKQAVNQFEKMGAKIIDIDLKNSHLNVPTYYIIAPAEASSNLSRFDGVRYGHRSEDSESLQSLYANTRSEGFGDEVKRRILIGSYVLSAGFYDAYYLKALRVRRLIANDYKEAFKKVDLILSPTTPNLPFAIGEKSNDPISMYHNDAYTIGANLAGLPAISFPIGFHNGLPIGGHFVAQHLREDLLLNAVNHFQKETDFHQQIPQEFDR
jgi:aspartyl-tRNA(Asn)/glutamyl-tRNA(Gln) amidotransferase subunit A